MFSADTPIYDVHVAALTSYLLGASMDHGLYKPQYGNSYALVMGINKYKHVGPLAYAVNDATAIARTLVEKFAFPKENVSLLLDREATKVGILQGYMTFTDEHRIGRDDRMFF